MFMKSVFFKYSFISIRLLFKKKYNVTFKDKRKKGGKMASQKTKEK